jgi:hypothetical protein
MAPKSKQDGAPPCDNTAKFATRSRCVFLCGQHCNVKTFPDRIPLAIDPDAKKKKNQLQCTHDDHVKEVAQQNKEAKKRGQVIMINIRNKVCS